MDECRIIGRRAAEGWVQEKIPTITEQQKSQEQLAPRKPKKVSFENGGSGQPFKSD